MNFFEKYKNNVSTCDAPSPMVAAMMEGSVPAIERALSDCDFANVGELEVALEECWAAVLSDNYLSSKKTQAASAVAKAFFSRAMKVVGSPNYEKTITATAEALWLKKYERVSLNDRRAKIFSRVGDPKIYRIAREAIMNYYGWTPDDMERLRYFVCQAKRENSDPVLNRSLYLFSKEKMTGKTTVAKIIAGILNGWHRWNDIEAHCGEYMSDIANELQFGNFDRPKGCRFTAVVMDEAFSGKNTKKYYGKFKSAITSSTCSIEVKFGGMYDVECSRNYIFTSNNDVSSVVSDESERRIMVIEMRKPKRLTYSEIVTLWRDFIVNAPDEDDVEEWYNSTIQDIVGDAGKLREDVYSAIVSEAMANELSKLAKGDWTVNRSSQNQVSFPAFFVKFCEREAGLRNCTDVVKDVLLEVFGKPNETGKGTSLRRYYPIRDILPKLAENGVEVDNEFV